MTPIEKAARLLCRTSGEAEDDLVSGVPRWTMHLPQLIDILDTLREPSPAMTEAGAEIIRHVGPEESEAGYQSDAANVWRFMIDALHQDSAHLVTHPE